MFIYNEVYSNQIMFNGVEVDEVELVNHTSNKTIYALVYDDEKINEIKNHIIKIADRLYLNEFKGFDAGHCVRNMELRMRLFKHNKYGTTKVVEQYCQGYISNLKYFKKIIGELILINPKFGDYLYIDDGDMD